MAPPPRSGSLRLIDPPPDPFEPVTVDVPSNEIAPGVRLDGGALHVEHGDGSTTIDFNPPEAEETTDDGFYANLVSKMDEGELSDIAAKLLDGIDRDIESRKEWLETRARGIQLLGLKLEEPRGDIGTSSAPLEGMSTVRHPLLLEATIRFQAMARGELLPASGPVKVRNDTPQRPVSKEEYQSQSGAPATPSPGQPDGTGGAGPNAVPGTAPAPPTPPMGGPMPPPPAPPPPQPNPAQAASPFATELAVPPMEKRDDLADALETDFNHYLTATATEYVPDTDRMLFYIGFGGDGFKKVYNCPLRRRPVSESVDAEDLIVSNSATDLKNCGRVTHKIKMRKSIVKRMQILGVYADIDLQTPALPKMDPVQEQKREIDGTNEQAKKPEDLDYEIFETYCELDLDQFAPAKFKGEGLPLPYRVTVHKDTRKVLSIVRNWDEKDEQCLPKQFFVQFPFIRGLGFYGLGFVHVLGNTTTTLTAMWREMVDAGMFSNFPGFIISDMAARQLSNQFRVPPGGSVKVQVPQMQRIQDAVMPLPYKEPGASFVGFAQWVEQSGQRLGQTAEIAVGEGKQEAPVGTTLALIEQATKLLDSVHKRLHWAQTEEFALLKERFKEDPEAFWRHNKRPAMKWEKEQFLKALDDYNLVPVADPNNPTSLHRHAKAAVLEGLASKYPQLMNLDACLRRVLRVAGIDFEGLMNESPLPPPPDPRMVAIQQKSQQVQATTQAQQQMAQMKAISQIILGLKQVEAKVQDRQSQEKMEHMRLMLEAMKHDSERQDSAREAITDHVSRMAELRADQMDRAQQMQHERASKLQELQADALERQQQMRGDAMDNAFGLAQEQRKHEMTLRQQAQQHSQEMQLAREKHQQEMAQQAEMHQAQLAQARALAATKKTSNTKKKSE